jgi:uncharacterized Zn ribbon protein
MDIKQVGTIMSGIKLIDDEIHIDNEIDAEIREKVDSVERNGER